MIDSVGPAANESLLRKVVDRKMGEYDRGRFNHGLSNDASFLRDAKKI